MADLERELDTLRRKSTDLAGHEGKFVVISGDDVVGIFDAYADALQAGYQKLGLKPFLVRKISAVGTVAYFSRELA